MFRIVACTHIDRPYQLKHLEAMSGWGIAILHCLGTGFHG